MAEQEQVTQQSEEAQAQEAAPPSQAQAAEELSDEQLDNVAGPGKVSVHDISIT